MTNKNTLSADIADTIRSMITIEKKFKPGEKLPNENELSLLLGVSRTTLREAVKGLIAGGYLEVRRGLGTFVSDPIPEPENEELSKLKHTEASIRDLYEMRLIMEPEAAYYAALRATDMELQKIAELAGQIAHAIAERDDRTELEHIFHQSIAKATHNAFMNQLIPIIQEAISEGVVLSEHNRPLLDDTVRDHRMIIEFMLQRNAEGARQAMKIHILHAMQKLNL